MSTTQTAPPPSKRVDYWQVFGELDFTVQPATLRELHLNTLEPTGREIRFDDRGLARVAMKYRRMGKIRLSCTIRTRTRSSGTFHQIEFIHSATRISNQSISQPNRIADS